MCNIYIFFFFIYLIITTASFNVNYFCSYCGAQIFEVYGLGKEIIDIAFTGSVSSIGGLTLDEVKNQLEKEFEFLFLFLY